jgi:hypothetical protein
MRTPATIAYRPVAVLALGALLSFACGNEAKDSDPGGAGSNGAGSGNASASGGTSSGGTTGTTGGSAGTSNGGSNPSGGTGNGGTDGGSGATPSGGDAGTTNTGGNSGSSNGGNAGSSNGGSGMGGSSGSGGGGTAGNAGNGGAAGTPSAGCRAGGTPPASGTFMIDVGGTMREYILKMPAGYDPMRPYRLIFAFHGGMYDAESVDQGGPPGSGPYYGIEALAGGSAIFVAPQALSGSWTNQAGRDVAYVMAMVTRFKAELCVDESRIFATGFSFGGIMTINLGCTNTGTFRAIAPMSANIRDTCDGDQRVAYWSSHGTNDPTIMIATGRTARDEFIGRNGCEMTTMPGDRSGCVNYQGCDAGFPVTWCEFTGVHEPAPFAGEAIWAFFSQF